MIRYKFGVKLRPNLSISEMEVACNFETPVSTYKTTPCYNPKDYTAKNIHFQLFTVY